MNPSFDIGTRRECRESWALPSNETIIEWAEKYVPLDRTAAIQGLWRSEFTPWVRDQLFSFQDPSVRIISTRGPSQGAKTAPALVGMFWAMRNAPGPMAYINATDDKSKEVSQERIGDVIEKCGPLKELFTDNRHDKTTWTIRLKTCTAEIFGSKGEANLESSPYRYVFSDEVRKWVPGRFQKVEKRTRTYPNHKRWDFTTPNDKGDEADAQYQSSSQEEWHVTCLGCGEEFNLSPPGAFETLMKWDTNETTRPGGKWNEDEVAKTLRIECPKCHHHHYDWPEVRQHFYRGRYVSLNPNAPKHHRGFRYNAFLPNWIRWRDLWKEFQQAIEFMKLGNLEPLKIFVTESMAESWDPEKHMVRQFVAVPKASYVFAEAVDKWGDFRFLAIDVQAKSLWALIRDWTMDGASRLVWAGELLTWGEVVQLQQTYKVEPHDVFVDSGDDARTVYTKCLEFGWVALKSWQAPGKEWFYHATKPGKKPEAKIFSERVLINTGIGVNEKNPRGIVALYHWSISSTYDILDRLKNGMGAPWEVSSEVPSFYDRHMSSWKKKETKDKRTGLSKWLWVQVHKDDHIYSLEGIQVVAASMEGCLCDLQPQTEPDKDKTETP